MPPGWCPPASRAPARPRPPRRRRRPCGACETSMAPRHRQRRAPAAAVEQGAERRQTHPPHYRCHSTASSPRWSSLVAGGDHTGARSTRCPRCWPDCGCRVVRIGQDVDVEHQLVGVGEQLPRGEPAAGSQSSTENRTATPATPTSCRARPSSWWRRAVRDVAYVSRHTAKAPQPRGRSGCGSSPRASTCRCPVRRPAPG